MDSLDLYDTAQIKPPSKPNVAVVSEDKIFGIHREHYSYVNISYVLCHLEEHQQHALIEHIRHKQSQALLCIVDYTLNGMPPGEIDELFTSQQEIRWKDRLGPDEWYRTRTKFTRDAIVRLVVSAGYHPSTIHCGSLDGARYRGYVIAENPEDQTTKFTSFPGT